MQLIRWYLIQRAEEPTGSGRLVIPASLRTLVQGRWTSYNLPDNWALVRIRGEAAQHLELAGNAGCIPWPRSLQTWAEAAPARLKFRLAQLGFAPVDTETPLQVLDKLGQFHQDRFPGAYKTLWSRIRERRGDEALLEAVED